MTGECLVCWILQSPLVTIEVSRDASTLVKSWLHAYTVEHDVINLPSPPKLTLWPERQGIGASSLSEGKDTLQKRCPLASKLKRRLVNAKRRKEQVTLAAASKPEQDKMDEPEESKDNVVSVTRKRTLTLNGTITRKCKKRRRSNIVMATQASISDSLSVHSNDHKVVTNLSNTEVDMVAAICRHEESGLNEDCSHALLQVRQNNLSLNELICFVRMPIKREVEL